MDTAAWIDYCKSSGTVSTSCGIQWDSKSKKKMLAFSTGWKTLTPDTFHAHLDPTKNGLAIRTGSINKLVVIDLDEAKAIEAGHPIDPELIQLLESTSGYIIKTPNGRHFYFHYDGDDIKTVTGIKWADREHQFVDIRAEGGIILSPPSSYKKNGVEQHYTILTGSLTNLSPVPESILTDVKKVVTDAAPPPSTTETLSEEAFRLLLDCLNKPRWDSRADWIKIGMILFNEGQTCQLWNDYSRQSRKWTPSGCSDAWRSFHKGPLTVKSLWRMVEEDSPTAYRRLSATYRIKCETIVPSHAWVAKQFYEMCPDDYRYCPGFGWWKRMPNNVWRHTKVEPPELKRDIDLNLTPLLDQYSTRMRSAAEHTDEKKEKTFFTAAFEDAVKMKMAIQNNGFLNSVQALLFPYYLDLDFFTQLDSQRNLFAFTNGVYDLDKGEFRSIEPADCISTTCGYAYEPANPTDMKTILELLLEIFDTIELRDYVLRVMAMMLHGHKRFQELYMWAGMGSNGKSLLVNLLSSSLGPYCKSIPTTYFTEPQGGKDSALPALSDCRAARMVWASEPEGEAKLQVGFIKQITGGDAIVARGLYSSAFAFIPQFAPVLLVNDPPKLNRIDFGVKRRLRVIPFPCQFLEQPIAEHHKPIRRELDLLVRSPEWRLAFTTILLNTFKNSVATAHTLSPPQVVIDKANEFVEDCNPVAKWLQENCDTNAGEFARSTPTELCVAFNTDRRDKVSPSRFGTLMASLGFFTTKSNGKLFYKNIVLRNS